MRVVENPGTPTHDVAARTWGEGYSIGQIGGHVNGIYKRGKGGDNCARDFHVCSQIRLIKIYIWVW